MSSKTVAKKMYMKDGKSVAFFNKPSDFKKLMGGLPDDIDIVSENADILLAFIEDKNQLKDNLAKLKEMMKYDGALWIAYHKQTSSVPTDINRDFIARYATENNLKGVAMVAINDDWSALRLKIVT